MRGQEQSVVAQIIESLSQDCDDDDEQMALLVRQLAVLDDKDLPTVDLITFMLDTVDDQEDIWLLDSYHCVTWEACLILVARCPRRIPVEPVVAALAHAYKRSAPSLADDSDENFYLEKVIGLAEIVGARFPADQLLPLLADDRIRVRRAVIDALSQHNSASVLATLLNDSSSQIRRVAMQHLAHQQQLTVQQAQALALDPNVRVKNEALDWMNRNHVASAGGTSRS